MNYRVDTTNRVLVDVLLQKNMLEVLLANDQLNRARAAGEAFQGFVEGDIRFRPTYKFDAESDQYDTSKKRR